MEANPGTMEAARYQGFRQAGITRLSLGVQSFDDDCLRRLGRIHDGAAARRAAEHAAAAGFDSFNIDLMFGLPGQDIAGAMQDVRLATELSGGHISHYQLTLEPNTVFYRRPPPLPADDDIALMQDRCAEVLAGAGYTRYEVSAWARSGLACRHNMNYWQFGDYLGIGAGAHGKLTVDGRILRRRRHRVPESWLQARPAQRVVASREVPQADLPLEFAMNSLRLPHGVPLRLFTERTGLPVSALLDPLASAIDGGQLTIDNDTLHATPAGLEHLNEILLPLVPEPADA